MKYLSILKNNQGGLTFIFDGRPFPGISSDPIVDQNVTLRLYESEVADGQKLFDLKIGKVWEGAVCRLLGRLYSFMPNGMRGGEKFLAPELYQAPFSDEIIFFGGTFNPWHEGHSECVRQAPSSPVFVVPDRNPWKEEIERASSFERLKIICTILKNKNVNIYPGFLAGEKKNPTYLWMGNLKIKKSMLIGDDHFLKIEKWYKYQKLLRCINHLYVVPRNSTAELLKDQCDKILAEIPSVSIVILKEHSFQKQSSTEIRTNEKNK